MLLSKGRAIIVPRKLFEAHPTCIVVENETETLDLEVKEDPDAMKPRISIYLRKAPKGKKASK